MNACLRILTVFCIVMSGVFLISCSSVSDKEAADNNGAEYRTGVIQKGKTIEDYFDLIGSSSGFGASGPNTTVYVQYQQTSDLGWVAWTDTAYIYTDSDVGATGIKIASTQITMSKTGAYDPDDF